MNSNDELRSILGAAASQRGGLDEVIQQLLFIMERQNEEIDRMEREITALRQHIIDMAGDLRTICPAIDEANRSGDTEHAREIVRQYYADMKKE